MGWSALILAAGRGPDDPMAKAYGVLHKCSLPIRGQAMLARVIEALEHSPAIATISVTIDDRGVAEKLIADRHIKIFQAENSAPASALAAIQQGLAYPVLITTGDHALLTSEMVDYFCGEAKSNGADFSVGLATAETILAAYPDAQRTFFRLGKTRVSGCNLFAVTSPQGLRLLERWRYLERARKKPWRLVAAFGPVALIKFVRGRLNLDEAFALVSRRLHLSVRPVLLPFAEAAIDIDKPADKEQAEVVLEKREKAFQRKVGNEF